MRHISQFVVEEKVTVNSKKTEAWREKMNMTWEGRRRVDKEHHNSLTFHKELNNEFQIK